MEVLNVNSFTNECTKPASKLCAQPVKNIPNNLYKIYLLNV